MKVVVDACAWSLLLRRRAGTVMSPDERYMLASLTEAIEDGRVVMIGPIRQEILSGIKTLIHFEKLRAALGAFRDEPLTASHYEEAARLFNLCRSRGVECGSTDILICAAAVEMQWDVLTSDQGLKRCLQVLKAEGLMP